jgi:hypothetical protein
MTTELRLTVTREHRWYWRWQIIVSGDHTGMRAGWCPTEAGARRHGGLTLIELVRQVAAGWPTG